MRRITARLECLRAPIECVASDLGGGGGGEPASLSLESDLTHSIEGDFFNVESICDKFDERLTYSLGEETLDKSSLEGDIFNRFPPSVESRGLRAEDGDDVAGDASDEAALADPELRTDSEESLRSSVSKRSKDAVR